MNVKNYDRLFMYYHNWFKYNCFELENNADEYQGRGWSMCLEPPFRPPPTQNIVVSCIDKNLPIKSLWQNGTILNHFQPKFIMSQQDIKLAPLHRSLSFNTGQQIGKVQ